MLEVRHVDGERFEAGVRGHRVTIDQPESGDAGPTPVELFVVGLASCVASLARAYLLRHGLNAQGLSVSADYDAQQKPSRVSDVRLVLRVPEGLPEERRRGMLAVASRCTVHNSLRTPPEVTLTVAGSQA